MSGNTKQVFVGNVPIGGGAPVSVQSMTNTKTTDIEATLEQIGRLQDVGCQIVRVAIPNTEAVKAFAEIKKRSGLPVVADIHFNHNYALQAIEAGADKVRINPGNIGSTVKVKEIVDKAVRYGIPIRVGVNAGSLEKDLLHQEGGPTVNALVKSAMRNIRLLRDMGAESLVLSLKSSDVIKTIRAYENVSKLTDVPLHIGVTEAGTVRSGTIKSAVAMGILLQQSIGDTLRVSLTGDPVDEVITGFEILKSLNLIEKGITFISCPTCGRTEVDLIELANQVEKRLFRVNKPVKVALMGCEVNGPGEAKDADIGIACGKKSGVLFKKGKIIKRVQETDIVDVLVEQVLNWK